jgi:hypothetical protein
MGRVGIGGAVVVSCCLLAVVVSVGYTVLGRYGALLVGTFWGIPALCVARLWVDRATGPPAARPTPPDREQ